MAATVTLKGQGSVWHSVFAMIAQLHLTRVHARIQELHVDYPTHELYLVRFLYAGYSGDPEDFMKGFLRSTLLVRVRQLTHRILSC